MKVLDLNDNKPEFIKKSYQFFVEENQVNLSLRVPPIEVYDVDTSERNSKLKFKIVESPKSRIARDRIIVNDTEANYPLLYLMKPFDYELDGDKVEFDLLAYDVDNFTDVCMITIFIKDTNDNSPVFMNDNSTFLLKENAPPNSFIGQVNITFIYCIF